MNRELKYSEAGGWARQYGSVRLTGPTFFVTIAVITLTSSYGDPATSPLNASKFTWWMGFVVMLIYSYMRRWQLTQQARIANADPELRLWNLEDALAVLPRMIGEVVPLLIYISSYAYFGPAWNEYYERIPAGR